MISSFTCKEYKDTKSETSPIPQTCGSQGNTHEYQITKRLHIYTGRLLVWCYQTTQRSCSRWNMSNFILLPCKSVIIKFWWGILAAQISSHDLVNKMNKHKVFILFVSKADIQAIWSCVVLFPLLWKCHNNRMVQNYSFFWKFRHRNYNPMDTISLY